MGISCQMCGTENPDGTKFCSACGNAFPTEGQATPVVTPGSGGAPVSKRTVMGIPTVQGEAVKGIPMAKIGGTSAAPAPAAPSPTTAARPKASPAHTMLGMAAVVVPSAIPKETPAEAAPASVSKSTAFGHRTMLGMPAVAVDSPVEHAAEKASLVAKAVEKTEPMDAVRSDAPTPAAPPAGPTEAMSIQDSPKSTPVRKKRPSPEPRYREPERDSFDDRASIPTRGRGLGIAFVIAGSAALIAVCAVIYLMVFDKSAALRPQILPSTDGKTLTVSLAFPGAPPGTSVQVAGRTASVSDGQARIVIPMSQIHLGTNDIDVAVSEPGSSPKQLSFPIVLRHSISDDFSGLVTEDPFVTAAFQIAPGVHLAVDGRPVQPLNNVYFHKIRLADVSKTGAGEGDFMMVKLPFQLIDEAGAVEQGEHVIPVPLTKLRVDRPAPNAKVVSDSVTCSGTSEEGAQITVDGQSAGLTAAGFSTSVSLPVIGAHDIEVTARAPGKAPRTEMLTVTRIVSLAPAVAEWSEDLDTSLDYPTLGRDPNAAVGRKIKLNGRVVNISTEKGVTAFILYVGEGCPARSKCAVYVVFRGETEAGLQSWVDVYGIVRGTRSVEMQNGVKIDVPAVDAVFVVENEKRKSRRRGR